MSVRKPAVAGAFYPENPDVLRADVQQFLDQAPAHPGPVPKAIVAPHAGYIYSGSTAAEVYRLLTPAAAQITRVLLVGPCHRVYTPGLAASDADYFRTPLGDVPVELPPELTAFPQVLVQPEVHALEHSLEVHIPFLQMVLDHFTLIPLVSGGATPDQVADVIEAAWGSPDTLIVVSSDMSHYLPYDQAKRIDLETIQMVEAGQFISSDRACGASPLNGLIACAHRRGLPIRNVAYRNSGDTAGDKSGVVGYGAYRIGRLNETAEDSSEPNNDSTRQTNQTAERFAPISPSDQPDHQEQV